MTQSWYNFGDLPVVTSRNLGIFFWHGGRNSFENCKQWKYFCRTLKIYNPAIYLVSVCPPETLILFFIRYRRKRNRIRSSYTWVFVDLLLVQLYNEIGPRHEIYILKLWCEKSSEGLLCMSAKYGNSTLLCGVHM